MYDLRLRAVPVTSVALLWHGLVEIIIEVELAAPDIGMRKQTDHGGVAALATGLLTDESVGPPILRSVQFDQVAGPWWLGRPLLDIVDGLLAPN